MIGILSGLAGKFLVFGGLAVGVASCGAYAIHVVKASGAQEVAAEVSRQALKQQSDMIDAERAAKVRLTRDNARIMAAKRRSDQSLAEALAALPQAAATEQCPENCLLPVLPSS